MNLNEVRRFKHNRLAFIDDPGLVLKYLITDYKNINENIFLKINIFFRINDTKIRHRPRTRTLRPCRLTYVQHTETLCA